MAAMDLRSSPTASSSTSKQPPLPSSRRSSGSLRRLVTRQPSSHGPAQIRPEARRAYGDGMVSDKADDGTRLLQQAANYATLAAHGRSDCGNGPYLSEGDGPGASKLHGTSNQPALGNASLAPPTAPAMRPLIRRTRSGQHIIGTSGTTSHEYDLDHLREEEPDGTDADAAVPRLSMSSADSSGGSEIKTPESIISHPLWQTGNEAAGGATIAAQQIGKPSSPALMDMADVAQHPEGLASAGFGAAERVARSSINYALVDAAQQVDADVKWNDHDDRAALTAAAQAKRSTTIKAKRPDSLLKLPSTSYRTDRTVTPNNSGPSTADATPDADASAKADSNPLDTGNVTERLDNSRSSKNDRAYYDEASESFHFPSLLDKEERRSYGSDINQQPLTPPPRSVASPDSWRSLLPEHDPYFIPHEATLGASTNRAYSDVNANGAKGHRSGAVRDSITDAGRRWSNSSQQSSFSLPGPTPFGYISPTTTGSLYELDGTFNASGSRAAFAPLQYSYNHSSRSLASPTPSNTAFSDLGRRTSGLIDPLVEQRRHASFSTFDNRASQNRSTFHHSPFVHPDYIQGLQSVRSGPPTSSSLPAHMTIPAEVAVLSSGSHKGDPILAAFPSSAASGEDGGRESWPSSRDSMQKIVSSSSGNVPSDVQQDNGSTGQQHFDPYSVDRALAEKLRSRLPGDLSDLDAPISSATTVSSPPSVVSTSSLLQRVCKDDAGAITTTRTTTTTTTTTTVVLRPTSTPSQDTSDAPTKDVPTKLAGSESDHAEAPWRSSSLARTTSLQPYPTLAAKEAPYDVSPLSPPTLPFLDSRPAPSSTDLRIETHPTHYTLKTKLPGFTLDGITLATKHHCQLVIVADKWDESNGGHFERRITFGTDADLKATRANFDGTLLKITVPRRL